MAVGNVGKELAPYKQSDTFFSRDAGFTWQEIHKDAHLWEFGDSGSVLVIVNDEEPTDRVSYSLDEGKTWKDYKFTDSKLRARSLMTVDTDTSRKFIVFADNGRSPGATFAVHIDFSQLTNKICSWHCLSSPV